MTCGQWNVHLLHMKTFLLYKMVSLEKIEWKMWMSKNGFLDQKMVIKKHESNLSLSMALTLSQKISTVIKGNKLQNDGVILYTCFGIISKLLFFSSLSSSSSQMTFIDDKLIARCVLMFSWIHSDRRESSDVDGVDSIWYKKLEHLTWSNEMKWFDQMIRSHFANYTLHGTLSKLLIVPVSTCN